MKKIILILVFIFAIGTFAEINATNERFLVRDCFGEAIAELEAIEDEMWSMTDSQATTFLNRRYAACWCLENHPECL